MSTAGIMDLFTDVDAWPRDGVDIRVHWRYYRDPPEFLTFMLGNTDGLHYGLWFDDGRTCSGVASYYNNDGGGIDASARSPLEAVRAFLERAWVDLDYDDDLAYRLVRQTRSRWNDWLVFAVCASDGGALSDPTR